MREWDYTVLELEEWNKKTCDFCSNLFGEDNKSVRQIRSRTKVTGEWISDDVVCKRCEEKYWNDELSKCNRCGRLQTKLDFDIVTGKNVCYCIRNNEDLEEKELPLLPHEEISQSTFYERQINSLQEQLNETEEALEIEREEAVKFQEKSEEWSKRQKQELLDWIKQLEEENDNHKEEIKRLKTQLEQLTSQQVAQIEVKETKRWSWLKIKK